MYMLMYLDQHEDPILRQPRHCEARGCPKTSIQRHSRDRVRLLADCVRLLTESGNP